MGEVLVGGSASLVVDLATKEDLQRHTDRLVSVLSRPHARYHRYHGARAPRAANAPFVIKLDTPRPPTGWLWELQWVEIHGDTPQIPTAIANVNAMLLAGAAPPDASLTASAVALTPWGGLDHAGIIVPGLAVPSGLVTIPDKSVVHTDEEVYAILSGTGLVAGAAFYHVTVGVIEKPQTPEALTW